MGKKLRPGEQSEKALPESGQNLQEAQTGRTEQNRLDTPTMKPTVSGRINQIHTGHSIVRVQNTKTDRSP